MAKSSTPVVTSLQAIPVAGRDSMLLNLSGAHGPFFTRNLLILTDSAGRTGVGEVPGGEKIRQTLQDATALVVGQPIGAHQQVLLRIADRVGQRVMVNAPLDQVILRPILHGRQGCVLIGQPRQHDDWQRRGRSLHARQRAQSLAVGQR